MRFRLLSFALVAISLTAEHRAGGVLNVALRSDLKTFNPVTAIDAPSKEVLSQINADLLTINRATQQVEPRLAESWTHSKDGKQYIVNLRPNLKFSDGSPFLADDVVYSWNSYLNEHAPQRELLLIDGKPIEVKKLNEHQVAFTLPQPYAAAERLFDGLAMLPRSKANKPWDVKTPPGEIVGMGPFRIKECRPGEAVILERNPYYWDSGKPYLDGISFHILADDELQLARFVSGDLDILNRLSMKSIGYLTSKGMQVTDLGPGLEYNALAFNLDASHAKPFFTLEFRKALSLATDRDSIVKLAYQGRATPLWGHVSPGNKLWHNTRIPHPTQDVEAAKAALKQAGFQTNSKGQLTFQNEPVSFSILVSSSSQERQQMAQILAADWLRLGIHAIVTPLDFRSVVDRITKTRQFETVLLGLGGGDADPNPEINVWLSSGSMHVWKPNQKKPSTLWEAEIDSLMHRQMTTINKAERKRLYDRVQEIAATQSPMIFLASPNVVVAQRGNIGNFHPAVLHHFTLWNSADLFFK